MEAFISKEQETLVDLIVQRIKETNAFVASGNIKETDVIISIHKIIYNLS